MFEDSMFESRVGHLSTGKRWTAVVSLTVQCALAGLVITLPLLHPAALPFQTPAPSVLTPLPPKPPVPVIQTQQVAASSASSAVALPVAARASVLLSLLPRDPAAAAENAPPMTAIRMGTGVGSGIPDVLTSGGGRGVRVSVAPAHASGPVTISRGVSQGMLLAPIRPTYPAIARAAGVQGTVVVEAVISEAGTIESLHVVSGPAMLQAAAVDAIRAARYRPYRLNGEPTAVQTTITVNFRMGG
jgi:protein TonB